MTRIVERFDDYRPFYDRVMAEPEGSAVVARYRGTELVQCFGAGETCTRAVIAVGPLDMALTLELVDDEGWVYCQGRHYCPEHRREATA